MVFYSGIQPAHCLFAHKHPRADDDADYPRTANVDTYTPTNTYTHSDTHEKSIPVT
jgi:hypothetical protein